MKMSMKRSLAAYIRQMDRLDFRVIACLILLNAFGLIMIYSASAYGCSMTKEYGFDSAYLLKKQAVFVVLGFIAMLIVRRMNYNWFRKWSVPIFIAGIAMIFMLKTSWGVESHGATRWLKVGPMQVQVAEIVKIAMVVAIAAFMTKYQEQIQRIPIMVLYVWILLTGIPAALVYVLSDNLSSAIILIGITYLLTFVMTNHPVLHIVLGAGAAAGVVVLRNYLMQHLPTQAWLDSKPFRYARIFAWISPETYADSYGFQPLQGLYAVASGGITGRGLGNSIQKLEKIPEAQNDMIFSIVCEELGIVGATVLLAMFGFLVYHLVRIAAKSENTFGRVLTLGIAFHIALQVLINMGVVLTIIPNTGVSLPFISYGGSAVLFTMIEMGMALSVDRIHMERSVQRKRIQLEKEMEQNAQR
ncbi:MAG: cell division protein FtsW [Lachnospiraceae bacterium]|nr:cell division protein FtsW [Lachnospiraceae bacterium]